MTGCLHCRKPFGMVRRGLDITLASIKVRVRDSRFCSEDCEQSHRKELQQLERVRQFLAWLHAPSITR